MDIGKAIYKILSDNIAVSSMVGTRIAPNVMKQTSAFPFIVYDVSSDTPIAKKDVVYPADSSLKITKGTLRDSIIFYRTKASKQPWIHGGYIGPRVKGKFRKNKGGYFGAWVEYGHKTGHKGKKTEDNPYMERAWKSKNSVVLKDGFKEAEKIFVKAVKSHEKRLQKYGSLGY